MSHITGPDRSQTLLLPESVDDYVGPENLVRFIDAFVDGLDLAIEGFARMVANWTGSPGYAPKDLLKLYIYGSPCCMDQSVNAVIAGAIGLIRCGRNWASHLQHTVQDSDGNRHLGRLPRVHLRA
jgi:hypothetical protein